MNATVVVSALGLMARLWWRHWPQLVLLVLIGFLANHALQEIAVRIGLANHVLGLCMLSIVVLAKLLVIIAMFHVLKPSLAWVAGLRASQSATTPQTGRFVEVLSLALAPFFAYYTAWGFLGDTVRDYSLRFLDAAPFGEHGNPLDALDAPGLIFVVAGAWALRRLALWRDTRHHNPVWKIVVTLCEAAWLFIGLFVINKWKDQVTEWWHSRVIWRAWNEVPQLLGGYVPTSVTQTASDGIAAISGVALYALLPLVWFAMAALIYGREVRQADELIASNARFASIAQRYRGLPALMHRSGEYFIKGYRSRFLPIVNCVRLTLTAGLPLLVLLCIGYRALNWLSLWAWIGVTHLIGPHPFDFWRTIGNVLGLLLVDPLQNNASVLVEPLRICLLAAVLETALAAGGLKARVTPAPSTSVPAQAQ